MGLGLAFLLEMRDSSLRSERDAELRFGCQFSRWCRHRTHFQQDGRDDRPGEAPITSEH